MDNPRTGVEPQLGIPVLPDCTCDYLLDVSILNALHSQRRSTTGYLCSIPLRPRRRLAIPIAGFHRNAIFPDRDPDANLLVTDCTTARMAYLGTGVDIKRGALANQVRAFD